MTFLHLLQIIFHVSVKACEIIGSRHRNFKELSLKKAIENQSFPSRIFFVKMFPLKKSIDIRTWYLHRVLLHPWPCLSVLRIYWFPSVNQSVDCLLLSGHQPCHNKIMLLHSPLFNSANSSEQMTWRILHASRTNKSRYAHLPYNSCTRFFQ